MTFKKMADCKHLNICIIIVLMFINYSRCEIKHSINVRIENVRNESREMTEGVKQEHFNNVFDIDQLLYPRGDEHKLWHISRLWNEYYSCTALQLDDVRSQRVLPCYAEMAYQGAVARLRCNLCVGPREKDMLTWMYAKYPTADNFSSIVDYDRMVDEPGYMIIYNVMPEDAGVYSCRVGDGEGGLVLLQVVDNEEPYTVVKPYTSRGPHPVAPEKYGGIVLFTKWSLWSECSVCDKVGRRHRHGICYIKLDRNLVKSYKKNPVATTNRSKLIELDDKLFQLFEVFPEGMPCRSEYLPKNLRNLDVVNQRPSEIMIGMCKIKCEDIERKSNVSNHASVRIMEAVETVTYTLTQQLPKQPPPPARNTLFADVGAMIAIRCPGTTLRNIPMVWRVGTKELVPRDVDKRSGGRVHVNSRDHLVFNAVLYRDANLYSCWQRGRVAGTVKLIVWEGAHVRHNHHVALLLLLLLAALLLRAVDTLHTRQSMLYLLY